MVFLLSFFAVASPEGPNSQATTEVPVPFLINSMQYITSKTRATTYHLFPLTTLSGQKPCNELITK